MSVTKAQLIDGKNAAVEFSSGSSSTPSVTFSGDTNTGIYQISDGELGFTVNGNTNLRVSSAGEVLIGGQTVSRGGDLQVEDTGSQATISVYRNQASFQSGSFVLGKTRAATQGGFDAILNNDRLGQIVFLGSDGSAMQQGATILVKATGNYSPTSAPCEYQFYTCPTGSVTNQLAMVVDSSQQLLVGYASSNGSYKLQVNSQIFATSGTIATSDGRYKTNVETLDGGYELIKNLRPVSFDWIPQQDITYTDADGNVEVIRVAHKFPTERQVGFIAQEVETVLTGTSWGDCVVKESVMPAAVTPDGQELAPAEEFKGIAEGNIIAILTSALKEAIAKIEDLETRLNALEG
jgi:hypothetical protein